jgi:hypothetical protein
MSMLRIYRLDVRSRPAAMALAAAALAIGAVFIAFGIVLLAALAAVATAIGAGVVVYRALTGGRRMRLRGNDVTFDLDPSLEVRLPERPAGARTSSQADKPTS